MNRPSFKTLFHFSNDDIRVIEIKRLDLPATTEKSKLFHWLLVNKDHSIQKLTFVAMSEDSKFQTREFKEGKLRFDDMQVFYDADTSHALKSCLANDLPDTLVSLLENYFT
ncbi:hypothetical protein [Kiloniella sp.]|uniref:hypothetical protein n=1 Tax=Kiloniella sp. TaxID=1938587 RepID=UPI003A91C2CE